MRSLYSKIPGKAGRKRCVNVSRSVSVCQSDPLALPKPPGRDRQAGCFPEKWLLNTPVCSLFQGHVHQFSTRSQTDTTPKTHSERQNHLMIVPKLNKILIAQLR